mmetsp:Transcript_39161/g.77033  ORF Transcript_39161/g.77033 Transcript_39161/m.77033 type:complete len:304 (-) Transcript_39161:197-1108(-)
MPSPSIEEVKRAAKVWWGRNGFRDKIEQIDAGYNRWGGSVPYALLPEAEQTSEFDSAVQAMRPDVLLDLVKDGGVSKGDEKNAVHRLLRMEAEEDFSFKSWAFCSLQARDAVLKGWGDKAMIDVAKLLTDLRGHGDMAGGLRGNLFEWFAHEKLISGETFQMEKMKNASEEDGIRSTRSPAETQDVQFGTTVKSVSRSKQDLEGLEEGDYGRPSIRIFPVLDAVSFPFGLQMAIGPHKQYKLKDFKDIAKLAGPSRSPRLKKVVFVVPADPQYSDVPEHSGFYCRWTGEGDAPECFLLPLPYS